MQEVEVLKMLCDGKRNKEIALELKLNEKTVSTYRSRIMKKLRVRNLVELVRKAQSIQIESFFKRSHGPSDYQVLFEPHIIINFLQISRCVST